MRIKALTAATVAVALLALPACDTLHESLGEHLGMASASEGHEEGHHDQAEHSAGEHHDEHGHPQHKILVTSPVAQDVTLTQSYVCQIHSRRHIEVCALEGGYLQSIAIREGQAVKQGDVMFKLLPTLYQARRDADLAEARLAQVEYDNTERLVKQDMLSIQELKVAEAKLAKAQAEVNLAQAEMNFTDIKAPFDGIVDRLFEQQGSLIEEGAMLTTLSDNSVMWVYFNVPEAAYLEYQAAMQSSQGQHDFKVELKLANHELFPYAGEIGAIEADFDSETGNIAFRADFPNPDALLRHGQTGTVLIKKVAQDAIVIPQRAVFSILAKNYVLVVGDDNIVRQREIVIENEKEDIFVVAEGLEVTDKIVLEGSRQVRDGQTVEYEFCAPEEVLANLKYHAE